MSDIDNELFSLNFGREGSDCTCPYYITLKRKNITVQEFIKYIMKDSYWKRDWGRFAIFTNHKQWPFRPKWRMEYARGEAKSENVIPLEIMNRKIKEVRGGGGWSNSDWDIFI